MADPRELASTALDDYARPGLGGDRADAGLDAAGPADLGPPTGAFLSPVATSSVVGSVTPAPVQNVVPGAPAAPPEPVQGPVPARATPPQPARPTAPPKPGDIVQQAAQAQDQALNQAGQDLGEAEQAKQRAQAGHIKAQADVEEGYARALAEADQAHQAARVALRQQAASETADWMQKTDELVRREPTPGRWWDNQGGFGKALWLLGLTMSTLGTGGMPGVKNFASDLILKEIDDDVARQKDRQRAELDQMRLKGQIMEKEHAGALADLADDHTAKVARLGVLEKALELRATAPGNADAAAAKAGAQAWVGEQKAAVAKDYYDKAVTMKEGAANRAKDVAVATIHETGANMRARLEAAVKLTEAGLKASAKNGDNQAIPVQSGVSVINGKGEKVTLQVPKDHAKDVYQDVQNFNAKAEGLAKLRDAYAKSGFADKVFNNDNERRAALKQLADPIIRQMGGRFNKDTVAEAEQFFLGENPESLTERFKGASGADLVKLLDKEIADLPGAAKKKLSAYPSNIADDPNASIQFDFERTAAPGTHNTPEQNRALGGAPEAPAPHPTSEAGYKEAKAAGTLPDLPTPLKSEVDKAVQTWATYSPGGTAGLAKAARDKVINWAAKQKGPGAEEAARDALTRIYAEEHEAEARSKSAMKSLYDDIEVHARGGRPFTLDEVKREGGRADRLGLGNLTAREIKDLYDAASKAAVQDSVAY